MNFAVDTRLSVSRVNLRPASLWRSGSEAHDLRHPGQSLLAHLNFGDVGTSEDAFSDHRKVTLLDRRKARGELETADISKRIEDHQLRSDENTSELQSLMRSSYAVFCLKKKN